MMSTNGSSMGLTLTKAHVGRILIINGRSALIQSLDGVVVGTYRIQTESAEAVCIANSPLTHCGGSGRDQYTAASVGYVYPGSRQYAAALERLIE